MVKPNSDAPALHPAQVLGAFGLAFAGGRRAAVLGDSASGLAERLAEASGQRVAVFDPDARRAAASLAAAASRRVRYAVLDDLDDVAPGSLDLIVIPDLAVLPHAEAALDRAVVLAGDRGLLLVASANPEASVGEAGLGYYALYDLFADRFAHVKMLGRAPFLGYTVADFAAEGDPAVLIDSSLMEATEEPDAFFVVAGQRPPEVEAYTLIQVPVKAAGIHGGVSRPPAGAGEATPSDRSALAEAQLKSTVLSAEIDKLSEQRQRAIALAEERKLAAARLSARVAELEAERAEAARGEQAAGRGAAAKEAAATEAATKAAAANRIASLQAELIEAKAVAGREAAAREAAAHRLAALQAELTEAKAVAARGLKKARGEADDLRRRLDAGEQTLEQARASVRRLETQVREARSVAERAEAQRHREVARVEGQGRRDNERVERERQELTALRRLHAGLGRTHAEAMAELEELRDEAEALRSAAEAAEGREEEILAELQRAREAAKAATQRARELSAAQAATAPPDVEIGAFEALLRERGQEVDRLRRDLREAERVGFELVRKLRGATNGALGPPAAAPGVTVQVDELTRRCARQEADLEAARWKVAALTTELEDLREPTADLAKLEAALRDAHEEIHRLRADRQPH